MGGFLSLRQARFQLFTAFRFCTVFAAAFFLCDATKLQAQELGGEDGGWYDDIGEATGLILAGESAGTGGHVNPNFRPRCTPAPGKYDCKHYSRQYCDDFSPRGNCFSIIFCGFPNPQTPCHAANLTRVSLGHGLYRYCVVEPQLNELVTGSCWTTHESINTYNETELENAICEWYRSKGENITCPLPFIDDRIRPIDPTSSPTDKFLITPRLPDIFFSLLYDLLELISSPQHEISEETAVH